MIELLQFLFSLVRPWRQCDFQADLIAVRGVDMSAHCQKRRHHLGAHDDGVKREHKNPYKRKRNPVLLHWYRPGNRQ